MKYKGQLSLHAEQGCGSWIQFHDDRGLHGDKNQYWNWNWTLNFHKKTRLDNIKIFDKENNVLYDGSWTFSRGRYFGDYIFYPLEIEAVELFKLCDKNNRCEIETDELVDALKEVKDD